MARATGIGSMPGDDLAEAYRVTAGEVGDLPYLPELPARGPHATMIGRGVGLLEGLTGDLQPDGWRVGVGSGSDHRRARSLVAQDLDTVEEVRAGESGPVKIQVVGPLTLAASVELPRGEKLVADHGARRELADSLAGGVAAHVADVKRRLGGPVTVQVDEPGLLAVLGGGVPTASGFGRYRSVHPPEADALLRKVVDAVVAEGAVPVIHCCAPDVPVALLRGAGFAAISFDLSLARADDVWAEAFEAGTELWLGLVPSTEPDPVPGDAALAGRVRVFFDRLGFGDEAVAERVVVTPTCGLAGASPLWARAALTTSARLAASISSGVGARD